MLSLRHASKRLSQMFVFSSLMLILASGCGKDAAIQLTKPDPPVPTTKFFDFTLTSQEPGAVGAELTHAHGKDSLTDIGQRKVEVPIGSSAQLKVSIPKDWQVDKWDCVPPGHVDYDREHRVFSIKNIQRDHSLYVSVQKTPVVVIPTHTVYLKLETPDSGITYANIPSEKNIMKFTGEGHRSFTLPKGKDLALSLKLPRNWEIDHWKVSQDSDYDGVGKSPDLVVKNIKSDLSVTAVLRKVPMLTLTVRVLGKSTLTIDPGAGSVMWKHYPPGAPASNVFGLLSKVDENISCESEDYEVRDISKAKVHTYSYPNGSWISVGYSYSAHGGLPKEHQWIHLTENKTLNVDFHKIAAADPKTPFAEALGFDPRKQQEPDIIYEEAKLFEAQGKE